MEVPEGFEDQFEEDEVCLLNKSLYGLKQSPRKWNEKFDSYIQEIGFQKSPYEKCAYTKMLGDGSMIYLLIYVDDMLVAARDTAVITELSGSCTKAGSAPSSYYKKVAKITRG